MVPVVREKAQKGDESDNDDDDKQNNELLLPDIHDDLVLYQV